MVDLKRVSATCEPYVQGSPMRLTAGIDAYFTSLKQPVPTPVDDQARDSIGKLLKQHAAYICSEKLTKQHQKYMKAAELYMTEKPAQWPDAPWIDFPQWCPDPACSGY
ncbi:hypothetical protein IP76_06575 [Rhizobium sp. AAP43]|nr:hypothetical protein IP76_06575 [Rhizobium sp. AAP43]